MWTRYNLFIHLLENMKLFLKERNIYRSSVIRIIGHVNAPHIGKREGYEEIEERQDQKNPGIYGGFGVDGILCAKCIHDLRE